ncbi:MAG: subunit of efflux transporter [Bacilli bacterium]|nr:subunit of efflux transporter [Bacilli bacterium]
MRKQGLLKRWRTGSFLLVAAMILTTALAGCAAPQKPLAKPVSTSDKKIVKVSKAVKQKVGNPIEQVADISASVQMDVVLKASGDVKSILKKKGDEVKTGDVIIQLDKKDEMATRVKTELSVEIAEQSLKKSQVDLVNNMNDMQNNITKAQQQIDVQTKDLNKLKNNYDAGLVDKKLVDQAQLQLDNALKDLESQKNKLAVYDQIDILVPQKIQVETARLALADIDKALDYFDVKAPASGILTDMTAVIGTTVSQNSKIGVIQTIDPVTIKTALTEDYAALVRGKTQLGFYLADKPDQKLNAKITYLANILDTQSRTYALELTADNLDKSLKPGMKVELQLTDVSQQQVLTVPTNSIIREAGDTFVFVYANGQVEKRKVTIGRMEDTTQEVLTGVNLDEQVVVTGQNQLKDKQQVELAK